MDETRSIMIHGRPVEYTILYSTLDGLAPEEAARRVKRMEDAARPVLRRAWLRELKAAQGKTG